ncbi:MAG: type II secretion system F family protein [Thermotogae bacterium]|nr:type II secretion system F family protein [Thermotogota bacterium]
MATYIYTARNRKGKKIKGKSDAEARNVLIRQLIARGFIVTEIKEKKKLKIYRRISGYIPKLKDIVIFSRQLSTMVSAGIRVVDALRVLSQLLGFDKKFKEMIKKVIIDIESGMSLSEAMKETKFFTDLFVSLVEAGEASGSLDITLDRAAQFFEAQKKLKNQIKSASAYPKFILSFAGITFFIIVFYIFPKLTSSLGLKKISGLLGSLMWLNTFVRSHFILNISLIIGIIMSFYMLTRTSIWRDISTEIMDHSPVIGNIRKKIAIARFSRAFSTLFVGGVPIITTLKISAQVTDNRAVQKTILGSIEPIKAGESLSSALSKNGVFPKMVLEMVEVGERSGRLEYMFEKIADFYDDEVDTSLKGILSILEPVLLLIVGSFIALLAYLVYGTIFKSTAQFGRGL